MREYSSSHIHPISEAAQDLQVHLRPAGMGDAPALMHVHQLTWPDEPVSLGRVESVLADPDHAVFVAEGEGSLVGFVDGFTTLSATGIPRWEVDLLAVQPAWRGLHLGQRLVQASQREGHSRGAALVRALIEVENLASQISFARCGFRREEAVLGLYVAAGEPSTQRQFPPPAGHLIPVNTINYEGLWLEEDFSGPSLAAARAASARGHLDLAGALVEQTTPEVQRALQQAGFSCRGRYQWWTAG